MLVYLHDVRIGSGGRDMDAEGIAGAYEKTERRDFRCL